MMRYQFDWTAVLQPHQWLHAIGVTLAYSLGTIVGGMVIGVICGHLLLSPRRMVRAPFCAYVQVFRCTPALFQIIWFYYHGRS